MATKAEREAKKAARRARLLRSNPWLQRPRRERLGFAAAGFCLFSIIGVLNTWFDLPATPPDWAYVLPSLLLSGSLAAGMVFYFDRPLIIFGIFIAFFAISFLFSEWEAFRSRALSAQTEIVRLSPEQENAVQEYRAHIRPALTRDLLITMAMMALGWFFVARALQKELQLRVPIEAELKVARKIQESLLPSPERKAHGWHLYGTVQPASEVAGDYFDYIELSNNRLGVLVADASGHGVSAGLMMAMLKSQLLNATVGDPQQLFSQLNRSVRKLAPKNMFVTAAYVILHPSHEAEVITVGHPPVLHYRAASRSVEEIRTVNTALGFGEKLSVQSQQCKLAAGDMLLLYTDGLFEQLSSQADELGLPTLKMIFARHAQIAPASACEQILAEVVAQRNGQAQNDDMTLVVVQPVKA